MSSENGSLAASTPSTNGPPGTSTDVPAKPAADLGTTTGHPGKPGKPAKPSPDFPLTPHPAGVWCKKIRGKLYYFGKWDDPEGALIHYKRLLKVQPLHERAFNRAVTLLEEAWVITRQLDDGGMESDVIGNLGLAAAAAGQPDRALALLDQSLFLARGAGLQ